MARPKAKKAAAVLEFEGLDVDGTIRVLNRILELELAGVVRYLHYSFMVFGHDRIPIVAWLRAQSEEGRLHAITIGEHITGLGGHPSLRIGDLLETYQHQTEDILREAAVHEREALDEYRRLLVLVAGRSIMLEEFARAQIATEEAHLSEVTKMIRKE